MWMRGYSQEHGQLASDYTTNENVSPFPPWWVILALDSWRVKWPGLAQETAFHTISSSLDSSLTLPTPPFDDVLGALEGLYRCPFKAQYFTNNYSRYHGQFWVFVVMLSTANLPWCKLIPVTTHSSCIHSFLFPVPV